MSQVTPARTICFTDHDVRLFADASGDANPLHLSPSYSRRTAFGRPVVHGVLGVIASLGSLKARRGQRIAQINAEFPGAMFTGIDYTVHVVDGPGDGARVSVADGTRTMLDVDVRFQSGEEPRVDGEGAGQWARTRPGEPILNDAAIRPVIEGVYRPDARTLQKVIDRYFPAGSAGGRGLLGVLLCASYLAGMELPGARSLLAGFSIDFESPPEGIAWPQCFTAGVASLDERFDLLRCVVDVTSRNATIARLAISSFLRPDVGTPQQAMKQLPSSARTMQDKVAVVTGASRGLGACLTAGLVARGGTVHHGVVTPARRDPFAGHAVFIRCCWRREAGEQARDQEGCSDTGVGERHAVHLYNRGRRCWTDVGTPLG